jgi:transcriptional regulator with XRE-family HTH domain
MTSEQVRNLMRARIKKVGLAQDWAREIGVSPQYVSDVLRGHREPGQKILDALGLVVVTDYRLRRD